MDISESPVATGGAVRMRQIWNTTYAVGEGCANHTDDVLLVQWMLQKHFQRPDKKALLGNGFKVPTHGTCDQTTLDIIRIFQMDIIRNKGNDTKVQMNGQVFPVRQLQHIEKYTLAYLNYVVRLHYPNYFRNPGLDPKIPSYLKILFGRCNQIQP
ncbi:MAG: hypothetical protein JNK48_28015 [Bryobacterales bacterium]|nr:hypothetical protein [Bryobacterales bacterium]